MVVTGFCTWLQTFTLMTWFRCFDVGAVSRFQLNGQNLSNLYIPLNRKHLNRVFSNRERFYFVLMNERNERFIRSDPLEDSYLVTAIHARRKQTLLLGNAAENKNCIDRSLVSSHSTWFS